MTFCARCGASVSSGTHCSSCGAVSAPVVHVASEPRPAGAGMKRPLGISILGGLWLVLGVLTGIFLAVGGALIATALAAAVPGLPLDANVAFVAVLVVVAAMAALLVWLGIGLLTGRRWAYVTSIVLIAMGILGALEETAGGELGALFDLLVGAFLLYYLLRPTTRAWFKRAPPVAPGVPSG